MDTPANRKFAPSTSSVKSSVETPFSGIERDLIGWRPQQSVDRNPRFHDPGRPVPPRSPDPFSSSLTSPCEAVPSWPPWRGGGPKSPAEAPGIAAPEKLATRPFKISCRRPTPTRSCRGRGGQPCPTTSKPRACTRRSSELTSPASSTNLALQWEKSEGTAGGSNRRENRKRNRRRQLPEPTPKWKVSCRNFGL